MVSWYAARAKIWELRPLPAHLVRFFFVSLLAWSASACGDDGDKHTSDDGHEPPDSEIGCKGDMRAMRYTAEMGVPGSPGGFRFVLDGAEPAPPAKGSNLWRMHVLDSAGAPLSADSLVVAPFMPDHNHGPPRAPVVSASGAGWEIDGIDLFMPGLWRVTVTAKSGATESAADFFFCVEG
jgi:hypothetical protein